MIKRENLLERNPKVPFRVLDEEAILLTPEDSMVHTFNKVGTRIWELLEEKISLGRLIGKIVEDYDGNKDTIEKDIIEFIEQLIERKMVLIDASTI